MTGMDGLQIALQIARRKADVSPGLLEAGGLTRAEAWAQKWAAQEIASEIEFEMLRLGSAER